MTHETTRRRRMTAVLAGGLLVFALASCGSSDSSDGAADAPADAPADATAPDGGGVTTSGGGSAEAPDPCQWYTAEEMSTLVGFEVTAEEKETPQALGRECLYNSDAEFTGITVRPTDAATYDSLKAGAASMGIGGAQVDYPGVGDAAYHNVDDARMAEANPSVTMSAKKGDVGIQVELAAASGSSIEGPAAGIDIVAEIAKKALDG